MKSILASAVIVAFAVGCGGAKKKKEEPLFGGEQASASCCCRIEGATPDDPTFALVKVMECSSRHGQCLKTEQQCAGQEAPSDTPPPPPPDDSGGTSTSF